MHLGLITRDFILSQSQRNVSYKKSSSNVTHHEIAPDVRRQNDKNTSNSRGPWKSYTLRAPFLATFITITLSFAAVIEILSHISATEGGLAFGATNDDISIESKFLYLYLPTIIAVLYSTFWSWVDLDVKRLEPWFQLSKPNGCTAANSLLLHYPSDFLVFVPITAARKRQWSVFFGGMTMMVIFWGITPMQSAMLTIGPTTITRNVVATTIATLLPVRNQTTFLDAGFLNTAYSILWLEQGLPPFTRPEYALLPTTSEDPDIGKWPNTTLKIKTTKYSTELTCSPANISFSPQQSSYSFDNRMGCLLPNIALPSSQFGNQNTTILYIGYENSPRLSYSLGNPNCSSAFSRQFLAIWASGLVRNNVGKRFQNVTASFCEASYHQQSITVRINAVDSAVLPDSITELEPKQLLPESLFNSTSFESVLAVGVSDDEASRDYPATILLEQYPRLMNQSLMWPITNMVGFAIASHHGKVEDLGNSTNLHGSFDKAHKLLFSVALNSMMLDSNSTKQSEAILQFDAAAIQINRVFALVVELLLVAAAILAASLLFNTFRRPNRMTKDPGSISDVMAMIQCSERLLYQFRKRDLLSDRALELSLQNATFRLDSEDKEGRSQMILDLVDSPKGTSSIDQAGRTDEMSKTQDFKAVRPVEMGWKLGVSFIISLVGATAALIYLRVQEQALNGLTRPTSNVTALQFLENYLPTLFATLWEPLWVVLNRLLCLLQPFEEMRKGGGSKKTTISADYTSLPPQLVLFRALGAKKFLLGSVCIIAILANVLAVTLSALFDENQMRYSYDQSFSPLFTGRFNGTFIRGLPGVESPVLSYADHFHVASTNISKNTTLPPWITDEVFLLPFVIDTNQNTIESTTYQATTRGFGALATCVPLTQDPGGPTVNFSISNSSIQFSASLLRPNGSPVECVSIGGRRGGSDDNRVFSGQDLPSNSLALEVYTPMLPIDHISNAFTEQSKDDGVCGTSIVAGWVRLGPEAAATSSTRLDTVDFIFMSCQMAFQTADFHVTVDATGRVIESTRISDYSRNMSAFMNNTFEIILRTEITQLISQYTGRMLLWHNETITYDWGNSLLKLLLNSTALVNPAIPLPPVSPLLPVMEDLFRRLTSIILGLNQHIFEPAALDKPVHIVGTITQPETRIFINAAMFQTTIVLLSLNIAVALAYFLLRPAKCLPRMPTTIASIIAYVAASHALVDFQQETDEDDLYFAFGRFNGVDGIPHVGIDQKHWVLPIANGSTFRSAG